MSKKFFGTLLAVAAVAVQFIPGIGQVVGAVLAIGLSIGASLLLKPSIGKISGSNQNRLQLSINVRRPRVIAFGHTAFDTDLRDQEYSGANDEFLHRFAVNAAHKVTAFSNIYFDGKLAWTAGGGVQAPFAGYLTVTPIAEGSPANAINISARMGGTRRYTGCAYVYFRFKLTGNDSKATSPFAQQVPTAIVIEGDAIPCYDVRQDSTRGGSGAHRATDQATWTFGAHARNPACQMATYMLGWRIQNPQSHTWKLSVGCGTPPDRIDWPSFIEAANLCDEPVTLAAGGTEPRYRGDGLFDEGDDPTVVIEAFKATMNADVDDQDGLIRLTVFHNDLATPDADFTEADVQGDYQWEQTPLLNETFFIVRGAYIEPDPKSLYQPNDYKAAELPSPDGVERAHPTDFGHVQSRSQAERLAKQMLQRQQYGGTFKAIFLASGWKVQKNSVVRLSFAPEGFVNKLFRVAEHETREDGLVPMTLREENAAIYAWDREESPAVQIATPTVYEPLTNPLVLGIGDAGNSAAPGDSNRVRFSKFEQELLGWGDYIPFAGPTIGTLTTIHDATSDRFGTTTGNFTAAAQQILLLNDAALTGNKFSRIPVTPGERVFVSALCEFTGAAAVGGNVVLNATFKDDANVSLSFVTIGISAAPAAANNRIAGFAIVPANAAYISLEMDINAGVAGAFTATLGQPMVCGAGNAQTVFPAFSAGPSGEPGAQVTRWVEDPPQRLSFRYDYTGSTAEPGEFTRDLTFRLMTSAGPIGAAITWTYKVLTGTVNGFTAASGAQAMTGAGTGTLTVASLATSSATVQVTATYAGKDYVKSIALTKIVADPPVGGGGGGGGSTTIATKTSGFSGPSTSTFGDISGPITGTVPSGVTAVDVNVNLDMDPGNGTPDQNWDLEVKVMRDIGGTPTQIGATQAGGSYRTSDLGDGTGYGVAGNFSFTIHDTGLTAGSSYSWRIYARVISDGYGVTAHSVTGSVTVVA